jgi:hypothetical protein
MIGQENIEFYEEGERTLLNNWEATLILILMKIKLLICSGATKWSRYVFCWDGWFGNKVSKKRR